MIQIAANCTIYALYKLRQRGAPIYADANEWLKANPDIERAFNGCATR
jgi:hypothetical protein